MSEGLPQGWARVRLDEVAEVRLGRQRSPDRATGDNMRPYMRAANVTWDGISLDDVKEMDFSPKEFVSYELKDGDILLSEASGSASEVGKPAIWRDQVPGCCFQNTLIRVRSRGPLPEYLHLHFLADARLGRFAAVGKGSGINHLGADRLSSWPTALPPLNEQRRIVAKLEALQARSRRAREALDAVPPLLEKLRQSILAAAFRGDLTKDWRAKNKDVEPATELLKRIRAERKKKWEEAELAKMKAKGKPPTDDKWKAKYKEPAPVDASGLPELPKGWCWASVDELVAAIEAGRSPKAEGRPAGPGEPGVLKVSAVSWEEFDANENKALLNGEGIGDTPTVRAGDLLISRANTVQLVGATVIVRSDHPNLMLSDKTLRLVPSSKELPTELLLYGLRTREVRAVFEDDATGTSDSMRNLSQEKIRTAPVAVPPALEARVLVEKVNSAMEIRRSSGAQSDVIVEGLVRLERALLAKAFRGELVPQDPNDEPADAMLARSGSPQEVLCVPERLTENRSRRRGKSA